MDCSPFVNWDEEELESTEEWAIVFWSLVATVKLQPALDDSLEAKAVEFLESSDLGEGESADMFLDSLRRPTDGSLSDFIQSIVVLLSSTNEAIPITAMEMLNNLLTNCSAKNHLSLFEADLIPQLINTLNPLSLSFAEAEIIHTGLITSIHLCLWLATPLMYGQLEIEEGNDKQAVHKTVLKQVLTPSDPYIWHLCVNRYSINDGEQSGDFLILLVRLLQICPYYQPTMDFVLHVPVLLTIPSFLLFFEHDRSIDRFLYLMTCTQREWNETSGSERHMGKTMHRMLRMEGIEDVIEDKHQIDKDTIARRKIVADSVNLNNLQGMNLPRPK
ncbi:hypothetical protein BLNAU_20261 [Blattamonas nauphoetae]|uniref:Uncharacterized protein n=1 Tax=Blattamonas nauphoetae TaxID=2049346 RepID=A0ABQ9WZP7_9EUKA|nr:hypothetical protein BLNAU_20261 [Blattamonas nauphoetae]